MKSWKNAIKNMREFSFGNTKIKLKEGESLNIKCKKENNVYIIEEDFCELYCCSEDRNYILLDFLDMITFLWEDYALGNESEMVKSAIELKYKLLSKFEKVD